MVDVKGKVVNYWTGKPISNATVMVNNKIATTNENGEYTIEGLIPSLYNITILHMNYERTVVRADLRVEGAYTIGDIRVKPIFRALEL